MIIELWIGGRLSGLSLARHKSWKKLGLGLDPKNFHDIIVSYCCGKLLKIKKLICVSIGSRKVELREVHSR